MAKTLLEVRYSRPFYLSMLVIGMVCSVGAIKLAVDPPRAPGAQTVTQPSTFIWVLLIGILLTMGAYMWRAMKRLTTPIPAIVVRHEGIVLNLGQPRLFRWQEITAVGMGRYHARKRLEITVVPERFAELTLPKLFSDDNFMAIRQKPNTIGITRQGLDHTLLEVVDAVRAHRANLIKR
jgi:hypothetical protein